MRSRTRMALTTGVIATQGTSRSRPPDSWLPSSSVAALNSRLRIRCRPARPPGPGAGAASGAQAEDLPGAHAGQVSADYESSRAKVPHQDRGLVEVERRPPWLPGDPAGHGDGQRAWPGALRGCGRQPFPVVEPVDLAG